MISSKKLILVGGIFIWLMYTILYQMTRQHHDWSFVAGYMALIGEAGLDVVLFYFCFKWLKFSDGLNKKILLIFGISYFSATISDGLYNVLLNVDFLKNNIIVDSLYDIPFIFFLFFQVAAWFIVLKNTKKILLSPKKFILFHMPYIIMSILILSIFLFGIHWKVQYLTVTGVYQVIDTFLEAIGFCLATICITRSKSNFLKLLGIGYLVIISSDFIIRSEVINNVIIVDNFFESTWILGLLISMVSFIAFYKEEKSKAFSLNPVNSISSFTGSSFLVFSLLLALTTCVIIFSFNNQLSISYLPSLFVIFAIISVIFTEIFVGFINKPIFDLNVLIEHFNNTRKILTEALHSNLIEIDNFYHYLIESFKISNSLVEQEKSMSNVATQVAHDLNNYLYTLHDCIKKIPNMTKRKYEELTYIIADIDMMAENLLKYRDSLSTNSKNKISAPDEDSQIMPLPVVNQLRKAIVISSAKSNANGYSLQLTGVESARNVFSAINGVEFRRIIINLINNANEAQPRSKQIIVALYCENDYIVIQIKDDGRGIPKHVLEKLGQEEISYGKHNGHGVGVYNAATMIKKWEGNFLIDSTENRGTTVTLQLPMAPQPPWYILSLDIAKIDMLVIVDDNKNIHQQWQEKLRNTKIKILNFYSPTETVKYYQHNKNDERLLFLIDYQYADDNINGIELIKSLSIIYHAVLVTGRSDELTIVEECKLLGIKIISKNMIDLVDINNF